MFRIQSTHSHFPLLLLQWPPAFLISVFDNRGYYQCISQSLPKIHVMLYHSCAQDSPVDSHITQIKSKVAAVTC